MGIYIQGGKEVGGMYMADGRGNATKIGGMYYADGEGNAKKIYSSFLPTGQVLYSIPTGYDGFFLSGNSGVNDINKFKSISGSSTIQLTQSIDKCKNGVQVNVFQRGIFQYNTADQYNGLYDPYPTFSSKSILIPKLSLTGSISFGLTSVNNTGLFQGTVTASKEVLKFTSNGDYPMGKLESHTGWSFWAITSIVSY